MAIDVQALRAQRGNYEPGDIVELVTGGPPMVVLDYCEHCGDVDVAYTTPKGKVDVLSLPAIALELAA